MALRVAIVGPGRVGIAFARALVRDARVRERVELLGVLGRDPERTAERVASIETGAHPNGSEVRVIAWGQALRAHVVVFAVGDGELESAIRSAVAAGGRPCSLWLHTSGRHGLEVFEAAGLAEGAGIRTGALHPLLPFSGSVETHTMHGAPATILGGARSMRLLARLCDLLGLQAIPCDQAVGQRHDRALYHAACAMAANGATALFALAADLMHKAGGLAPGDGARIVSSLMAAAVDASVRHGAGKALSGPVRRGDDATVNAHLEALDGAAKEAMPAYVALMTAALELAREQGLGPGDCDRIASALSLRRSPS